MLSRGAVNNIFFFFPFKESKKKKKCAHINAYPNVNLMPDLYFTVMWKHYIGLYLFEWKFEHVLQCFLGLFMLFGLKATLVLAVNMTLVGSLLLGRVSFHGIIYMWVHCMPMLESTEVFGRCLSFHSKEPIWQLLNCPCKHIILKEARVS